MTNFNNQYCSFIFRLKGQVDEKDIIKKTDERILLYLNREDLQQLHSLKLGLASGTEGN